MQEQGTLELYKVDIIHFLLFLRKFYLCPLLEILVVLFPMALWNKTFLYDWNYIYKPVESYLNIGGGKDWAGHKTDKLCWESKLKSLLFSKDGNFGDTFPIGSVEKKLVNNAAPFSHLQFDIFDPF